MRSGRGSSALSGWRTAARSAGAPCSRPTATSSRPPSATTRRGSSTSRACAPSRSITAAAAPEGVDCSGTRAGNLYIQYFAYYPGSATGEGSTPLADVIRDASTALGSPTYHPDDWESFQVKVTPGRAFERASAHHGYGGGWCPDAGAYFVSGGSHAGTVLPRDADRETAPADINLIALEPIAASHPNVAFAITPPWIKKVWFDPEYEGTD
jgi:hypothetical protein